MTEKSLSQAVQDILDAVKALSTTEGINWSNPAYAPLALAHANLHDAASRVDRGEAIDWEALRESVKAAGFFVAKAAPDAPDDYLWGLIRKVYTKLVTSKAGKPK